MSGVCVDRVLSKTLAGLVVIVGALKNPGEGFCCLARSQKPWWGFVLTVFSLKNPGRGFYVTVFALKKPGRWLG